MKFGLGLLGLLVISLYGVAQEKELALTEPADVLLGMIQKEAGRAPYPKILQQEYTSPATRKEVESLLSSLTSGPHGATIKGFLHTEAGAELLAQMPVIQFGMCTISRNALMRGYGKYKKLDPISAALLEEAGFLNSHCK